MGDGGNSGVAPASSLEALDTARGWRRSRTVRRMAAFGSVWVYSLSVPLGCASAALVSHLLRRDEVERARRMQRMAARAYRFLHGWLNFTGIVEFDRRNALRDVPQGPCVVVANHPTLIDITAIAAALGHGFTIVKPKLHARWSLRPFMDGAGYVAGASEDPASTGRVVDECVARLRAGSTLIVFPEGTRSPDGGLRPFGRTAFEIACRARVPLVSVTVECRPLFLSKGASLFYAPEVPPRLRLGVLAVDHPGEIGESRALLQRVEARFRRWHAERCLADPRPDR